MSIESYLKIIPYKDIGYLLIIILAIILLIIYWKTIIEIAKYIIIGFFIGIAILLVCVFFKITLPEYLQLLILVATTGTTGVIRGLELYEEKDIFKKRN